jgi:hypothetical protein
VILLEYQNMKFIEKYTEKISLLVFRRLDFSLNVIDRPYHLIFLIRLFIRSDLGKQVNQSVTFFKSSLQKLIQLSKTVNEMVLFILMSLYFLILS